MEKNSVNIKNELLANNLIPSLLNYVGSATLQELITSEFSISEFLLNSAIRTGDIKLATCVILGDSELLLNWTEDTKLQEVIKEMSDTQLQRLENIVLAFDNDIYKIVKAECVRRKL